MNLNIYRRLIKYLSLYKKQVTLVLLLSVVNTLLILSIPYISKNLIDVAWVKKNTTGITKWMLLMILAFFLSGLVSYLHKIRLAILNAKISITLQNLFFRHVLSLPIRVFEKYKIGDIVSRMHRDILLIQELITGTITNLGGIILMLVGSISICIYLNIKLTLVTVLILPPVIFTSFLFGEKIKKTALNLYRKIGSLVSDTIQCFSGIKTIKSFHKMNCEIDRFVNKNKGVLEDSVKVSVLREQAHLFMNWFTTLPVLLIVWFGSLYLIKGEVSPGTMVAFLTCIYIMLAKMSALGNIYITIKRGISAGERFFEVLDLEVDDRENSKKLVKNNFYGDIEFRNVCFGYDGKEILHNISLRIKRGEVIALVGPSAVGKTTVVDLILKLFKPFKGDILIDGINIKDIKLEDLRRNIGIMDQTSFLFNRPIKDNITYGLDGDIMRDKQIVDAARIASIHNSIIRLKGGYNTRVGENGVNLSIGQKQRIAIARAIIKRPKILILDEATSSLDGESEGVIHKGLYRFVKENEITTIIISHRLSTILSVERILVLKDGKIQEQGTHQELMKRGKIYQELYKSQIGLTV